MRMVIDRIKYEELKKYKKTLVDQNYYIAEIDGNNIYNLEDYMNEIIKAFKFPDGMFKNKDNIDSYEDLMRDLGWLGEVDGFALFIINEDKMLTNSLDKKKIIFESFYDTIIPFWTEEVEHVVVEGKTKIFDVFVVD
jgi:hypothetical protein